MACHIDPVCGARLTEEATNDEEWGPATKVMASIAEACCHMEDYPRVVQVLHGRLSLIGKKHWRQFLKTLTVVEYLLLHGPEEIALEFSSDRDLIEDLSRFNYVDDRMYGGSLTCLYEYQYTVL
jgi:epsin